MGGLSSRTNQQERLVLLVVDDLDVHDLDVHLLLLISLKMFLISFLKKMLILVDVCEYFAGSWLRLRMVRLLPDIAPLTYGPESATLLRTEHPSYIST